MKIKVSYSELVSTGNFSNKKVEAELEVDVNNGDLQEAYDKAYKVVKNQVDKQLGRQEESLIDFSSLPF